MNDNNKIKESIAKMITLCHDILELIDKDPKIIKIIKPFKNNYRITQNFGENPNLYKQWGYAGHFGVDFATPWGTEILAVDDGIVNRVTKSDGNGWYIELKHSWGYSIYLHFKEKSNLGIGDKVKQGQIIGYSGNTGYVIPKPTPQNPKAGSHLHFSLKINGIENKEYKDYLDPMPYFT